MNILNRIKSVYYVRKEIWLSWKESIALMVFKKKWRELNKRNGTKAINIFPAKKVYVGVGTYGGLRVLTFDNNEEKLIIGNYCSIAENVTFLLGGEHDYKCMSTFPYWTHILNKKPFKSTNTKGPIIIEDEVWIGFGALILSGVKIGKGSIIGAGSIVSKDIPPYAIYVDNRILKYRFEDEICEQLMEVSVNCIKCMPEEVQRYYCSNHIKKKDIDELLKFKMKGENILFDE